MEPEPELVAAASGARGGDQVAFARLVALTHARIYRLALRLLADRDEAEDAVQDTYIRAWGSIGELREPTSVLGWLGRIARNAAHDRRRWWQRRRREPFDELSPAVVDALSREPAADELLASAEVSAAVSRAVESLPERHRVVLLLREADGMSYEEIAQVLGVPLGTVESRLHRARAALAAKLEKRMGSR